MKKTFLISVILSACIFALPLFAEDEGNLKFSTTTDFAFYPKSNYIAGGNHFAPLTGFYSGIEGRVTGNLDYTIPTPLGDNWLLKSANVVLNANLELSPVSVKPGVEVTFTPLPFLVFSAGAEAGTGWDLAGLRGMAEYIGVDGYEDYTPFKCYFLKWFAQGTFQFDTGAIWSGDWTHVQIMYTYQTYYEGLTGADAGDIWMWQCSGNKANGLCNYQSLILAYQMPMAFKRVGVMMEINGHYKSDDYDNTKYANYNGSFKSISISPLAQFKLGSHDNLSVLLGFSSRRSYEEEHTESTAEPYLTFSGREWYFNRVALSWTHNF